MVVLAIAVVRYKIASVPGVQRATGGDTHNQ